MIVLINLISGIYVFIYIDKNADKMRMLLRMDKRLTAHPNSVYILSVKKNVVKTTQLTNN